MGQGMEGQSYAEQEGRVMGQEGEQEGKAEDGGPGVSE